MPGAIAGAVAEAYNREIDGGIIHAVFERLLASLTGVTRRFTRKYCQF